MASIIHDQNADGMNHEDEEIALKAMRCRSALTSLEYDASSNEEEDKLTVMRKIVYSNAAVVHHCPHLHSSRT
eukprot:scaffold473569_cov20-Prasinocladus_malaysianus.AAC.1